MGPVKLMLGVLGIAVAGALAGVLFAPDKGSKTRKKLMRRSNDYSDTLKDKFDEVVDSITEKYEATRRDVEALVSKGKAKYDGEMKEYNKKVPA